jgi:hypothetical protein
MPPTPKPNGQRRRRNAVPGIATLAKSGREGPAPEPETSVVLCDVARRYWDAIWASPMALVYTDVDVFPLSRMAVLVHQAGKAAQDADDAPAPRPTRTKGDPRLTLAS